jgi:hypothetical protein
MQSSVEWLIEQLKDVKYNPLEKDGYSNALDRIFEQSKSKHKQEIIDAYMDRMDVTNKEVLANIIGEEYYQKTFK